MVGVRSWWLSTPVVGAVTVTGTGKDWPGKTTTALPLHVVEDRCGRAVLMHGGTVGDGRG